MPLLIAGTGTATLVGMLEHLQLSETALTNDYCLQMSSELSLN